MIIFIILFIIAIIFFLIKKRNAKKEVARREKIEKSRQKAINDNRLKQLKIEKKEWDLELSIDKEVMCDDGVKRIYNGFMWGLIREIDEEKTINTTSIISHDKSDNISLTSFRSAFRLEIPNEKWFSMKGKSLNSHEILNYRPSNKIRYESKFDDLLTTVKYNPTYSKKSFLLMVICFMIQFLVTVNQTNFFQE